jgi:hypothetical protein
MEHDVLLTRPDGSKMHFSIYGRPIPHIGDIVTMPMDGHLIKARIGEIHGVASPKADTFRSIDHVDADAGSTPLRTHSGRR